ncbi:MAG TPA: hypothetical protein VF791_20100 [Pyrinomonadaceae bacterium]
MKRFFMWSLITVIFLAIPSLISAQEIKAQEDPRPYNRIADIIAKAIAAELPDWERKSVPPINRDGLDNFSQEVIIDQWSSREGNVRVALFLHPSEADAKNAFEKFTAGVKANEHLPDVDNEAFAWGINKSIALRRGSYAIYISSIALNVRGDDVFSDKKPKEEARLSKMFAKLVVKALKDMR